MEQVVADSVSRRKFAMQVIGLFGLLGCGTSIRIRNGLWPSVFVLGALCFAYLAGTQFRVEQSVPKRGSVGSFRL